MINILPEFESRQVLTSDELNWLTCYLDTQERKTRRLLIGSGLIGGLQVVRNGQSIRISNGCGLTSAGHIVTLDHTGEETVLTRMKKYVQKKNEKLAFPYLSDTNDNEENYVHSVDADSVYFPEFKDDFIELFEETVNDANHLTANDLNNKVVLLFAEIIQKELKDCEEDNCQERGKKYVFNTKVLLVSKEDALGLLNRQFQKEKLNENQLSRLAFPWLHLPNINILKPVFGNINVSNGYNEQTLINEYLRCINDFIDTLSIKKSLADETLNLLKAQCSVKPDPFNYCQALLNVVQPMFAELKKSIFGSQILYDYLWKFAQCYQEIQHEAQSLRARLRISEAAFPNHILLGTIETLNDDFDSITSAKDTIYRHPFYSQFSQTEQSLLSQKIMALLSRLEKLTTSFDKTVLSTLKEIKLTAGGHIHDMLSKQAIPYYLNPLIAQYWNQFGAHLQLRTDITRYEAIDESKIPSAANACNVQPSAFQRHQPFFRIEGIHKTDALSAMNTVFNLRKKYGLPFEVLMLRLSESSPFSHSFSASINEDIDSLYQVVRVELLKQIQFSNGYLGSLTIQSEKFNKLKSDLTEALQRSYQRFVLDLNLTLKKPLELDIIEAVTANSIFLNKKTTTTRADSKFEELENNVSRANAKKQSAVTENKVLTEKIRADFSRQSGFTTGIMGPLIVFLFSFSVENLVEAIKADDKFKKASDISFYSHLMAVAEAMQKNEKNETLFLKILQLYCALHLQAEYLEEDFAELDIDDYTKNLSTQLLPVCRELTSLLKKRTVEVDSLFDPIKSGDIQPFIDRVQFEDDWVKINQIDAEDKKRNGGLGIENLLERFVKMHPAIAHGCGVPSGGTYIMVYDSKNAVTADFHLPYLISSHLRPIQFTLLDNKSITLSGTVTDKNGAPVSTNLTIDGSNVFSNKDGFYTCLVAVNTTIKITCTASGFLPFEKEMILKDKSEVLNITLSNAEQKKKVVITFVDVSGKAVKSDIQFKDESSGKSFTAKNGEFIFEDYPAKEFKFIVEDAGFVQSGIEVKEDAVTTVKIVVTDVAFLRIQILDKTNGKFKQELFKGIVIEGSDIQMKAEDVAKGIFVSTKGIPKNKEFTAAITYNQIKKSAVVSAAKVMNEVVFEQVSTERTLPVIGAYLYAATRVASNLTAGAVVNKIPSININGKTIKIDPVSNIGKGTILTKGALLLDKPLTNPPVITIQNFAGIQSVITIVEARLVIEKVDIAANHDVLSFSRALTAAEIKTLSAQIKEFKLISTQVDLTKNNFYCFIISPAGIKAIKTLLGV